MRFASTAIRTLALALPPVLVAGLALAAAGLALVGQHVISPVEIVVDTALLGLGAVGLALPVGLRIATRAAVPSRLRIFVTIPPVVLGAMVGLLARGLFGSRSSGVAASWTVALLATAVAVLPRLAADLGSVLDGARRSLVDAALALGASRPQALRLALAGEAAPLRALAGAVAVAAGDGIAAAAALALIGAGPGPRAAGLVLIEAGQVGGPAVDATLGLCMCFLLLMSATTSLAVRDRAIRADRGATNPVARARASASR